VARSIDVWAASFVSNIEETEEKLTAALRSGNRKCGNAVNRRLTQLSNIVPMWKHVKVCESLTWRIMTCAIQYLTAWLYQLCITCCYFLYTCQSVSFILPDEGWKLKASVLSIFWWGIREMSLWKEILRRKCIEMYLSNESVIGYCLFANRLNGMWKSSWRRLAALSSWLAFSNRLNRAAGRKRRIFSWKRWHLSEKSEMAIGTMAESGEIERNDLCQWQSVMKMTGVISRVMKMISSSMAANMSGSAKPSAIWRNIAWLARRRKSTMKRMSWKRKWQQLKYESENGGCNRHVK